MPPKLQIVTPESSTTKQIDVVGAVIVADGRVLAALRGPSMSLAGYWEFPGGKVELGEDPRSALRREIHEELECVVAVGKHIETTRHEYPFGIVLLRTFWASLSAGEPTASEHSELRWCTTDELAALRWAPADLPTVERVRTMLEVG